MAIKLEIEDGKIYASTRLKNGKVGAHINNVTEDAIRLVFEHMLTMRMHGDGEETVEYTQPVLKHGRKYKIQVTMTPME